MQGNTTRFPRSADTPRNLVYELKGDTGRVQSTSVVARYLNAGSEEVESGSRVDPASEGIGAKCVQGLLRVTLQIDGKV